MPEYYKTIDFTSSGTPLKNALGQLISYTHTNTLSYTPGVWDALTISDRSPYDTNKVVLFYGYNDQDGVSSTDRTRMASNYGGSKGQWNREHVFPKSLGNPDLGTSGPGADAHMLRPTDVQRNGLRSNLAFIDGSGNSKKIGGGWYPGDEWKGDVARIMMYMYLRYDSRCEPNDVAISSNTYHLDVPDLFLEWNAEDTISDLEVFRNNHIATLQGNRNPFIDNPFLAQKIWGGPSIEDKWDLDNPSGISENHLELKVYPNPFESTFRISSTFSVDSVVVCNSLGKVLLTQTKINAQEDITLIVPIGCYWLKVLSGNQWFTYKLMKAE